VEIILWVEALETFRSQLHFLNGILYFHFIIWQSFFKASSLIHYIRIFKIKLGHKFIVK